MILADFHRLWDKKRHLRTMVLFYNIALCQTRLFQSYNVHNLVVLRLMSKNNFTKYVPINTAGQGTNNL